MRQSINVVWIGKDTIKVTASNMYLNKKKIVNQTCEIAESGADESGKT